jgi:hypothetical protein
MIARLPVILSISSVLAIGPIASASWAAEMPEGCPNPVLGSGPGGSEQLTRIDPFVRLTWIDQHLSRTAHSARIWKWGWGAGIIVATAANLAPIPFVARSNRIDWYTGAATTIVGIVPLLIAPLEVIDDSDVLHAKLVARPSAIDANREDVCVLLGDAETRLLRDAKNQADGRRWWLHVGNVVLNSGVGLFLGLGYHHWLAGAFNAIGGTAIGELIILTQPTGTIDDLRRYRRGDLGEGASTSALSYRGIF